jgi:transposase
MNKDDRDERIRKRRERGDPIRRIARAESVSRNTVRQVLRDARQRLVRRAKPSISKLDPYRAKIRQLVLDEGLSGVRVLEEIKQLGYPGGKSILNEYIAAIRPKGHRRPTTRIETLEGEEGQTDWSRYTLVLGDQETVVHAFSYVLGYSRMRFLRFALSEDLTTIINLHKACFAELKGSARLNTFDNMTTVGRHVGPGEVWLNPGFKAFADHYGFAIKILPPGRPNLHGKVESSFRYTEINFLAGRRFDSLDHLNHKAQWWCDTVANVRIHGTLRERPVDRYKRELPFLVPLPRHEFDTARVLTRKVAADFCVAVNTSRYSVPPKHVGRQATIKVYEDHLKIFIQRDLVAVHPLVEGRYGRHVLPEHEEAFRSAGPKRELLKESFFRMGQTAERFYEGLVCERGKAAGYHLARILQLSKRHGTLAVAGALTHAGRYGAFSAEAVVRILHGRQLHPPSTRRDAELPCAVLPPADVRRWLESLEVEAKDLSDYDRLLNDDEEPGTEE